MGRRRTINQLIFNLAPNSAIVLDISPYHNTVENKAPLLGNDRERSTSPKGFGPEKYYAGEGQQHVQKA
jgi:hypothetical protein